MGITTTDVPSSLHRFVTATKLLSPKIIKNSNSPVDIQYLKKHGEITANKLLQLFSNKDIKLLLDIIAYFYTQNQVYYDFYYEIYHQVFSAILKSMKEECTFIQKYFSLVPTYFLKELCSKGIIPQKYTKNTKYEFFKDEKNNIKDIFLKQDSLLTYLVLDDVDTFTTLYIKSNITHQYCYIPFLNNTIPILDCCVIFHANKCFDFLISQGSTINEDTCKQILRFGNISMIEHCRHFTSYFECYFMQSIIYNNNEIADWILNNSNTNSLNISITGCISSYNISALLYFTENFDKFQQQINDNDQESIISSSYYDESLIKYIISKYLNTKQQYESIYQYTDKSLLHSVFSHNVSIGTAKLVLQRDRDHIHHRDRNGCTPLLLACSCNDIDVVEFLISSGANINDLTYSNQSILHQATFSGNKELVSFLLEKRIVPIIQDLYGHSAYDIAIQNGYFDIIDLFNSKNFPERYHNAYKKTPLHYAVEFCNYEKVLYYSQKHNNINSYDYDGWTPFLISCKQNNIRILKYFLLNGANLKSRNSKGSSPLHIAIENNCNDDIILILMSKTDNLKKCLDYLDNTPLHIASKSSNIHIIQELISKGCNVNSYNSFMETPLHIACVNNNFHIAKFLIKNGAFINTYNNLNNTPLHLACMNPDSLQLIKLLIKNQANINTYNNYGDQPLHVASTYSDVPTISYLLSCGSKIDNDNIEEYTPFLLSCEHGKYDNAEFLIRNGSNIKFMNKKGESALILACKNPNAQSLISYLLSNKTFSVNEKNNICCSPLFYCCCSGNLYSTKQLIHHGADIE